jgi:hypothetical protein
LIDVLPVDRRMRSQQLRQTGSKIIGPAVIKCLSAACITDELVDIADTCHKVLRDTFINKSLRHYLFDYLPVNTHLCGTSTFNPDFIPPVAIVHSIELRSVDNCLLNPLDALVVWANFLTFQPGHAAHGCEHTQNVRSDGTLGIPTSLAVRNRGLEWTRHPNTGYK